MRRNTRRAILKQEIHREEHVKRREPVGDRHDSVVVENPLDKDRNPFRDRAETTLTTPGIF